MLHDAFELIKIDHLVAVLVGLFYHLEDLFVCHVFAQLFRNPLEVFEPDFARIAIIEDMKTLLHLLFSVPCSVKLRHDLQVNVVAHLYLALFDVV